MFLRLERPRNSDQVQDNQASKTLSTEAYAQDALSYPNPYQQTAEQYLPDVSLFDAGSNDYQSALANYYFAQAEGLGGEAAAPAPQDSAAADPTDNGTYALKGISVVGKFSQPLDGDYPSNPSIPFEAPTFIDANTGRADNAVATDSGAAPAKTGWTYLVDEAVTIDVGGTAMGAPHRSEDLKSLAARTANTPDQIIVQASNGENNQVTTYRISGGQVHSEETHSSEGFQGDLQHLVSLAPKDGQVALFISAHGDGGQGMIGDNGSATIPQIARSIQDGQIDAGRTTNISVVSLDGCAESTQKTLEGLGQVADYIVAPETNEGVLPATSTKPGVDGQSLSHVLEAVVGSAPQSGLDVAQQVLDQSKADCSPEAIICGADTLAVMKTSAADAFNKALSNFGDELSKAIDNLSNRDAIDQVIESTPEVTHMAGSLDDLQLRDAKAFGLKVQQDIIEGRIEDPDNKLFNAAQDFISAHDNYVVAQYNVQPVTERTLGVDEPLNGISLFLPSKDNAINDPDSHLPIATGVVDNAISTITDVATNLRSVADDLDAGGEQKAAAARTNVNLTNLTSSLSALESNSAVNAVNPLADETAVIAEQAKNGQLSAESLRAVADSMDNNYAKQMQDMRDDVINEQNTASLKNLYVEQESHADAPGMEEFVAKLRGSSVDDQIDKMLDGMYQDMFGKPWVPTTGTDNGSDPTEPRPADPTQPAEPLPSPDASTAGLIPDQLPVDVATPSWTAGDVGTYAPSDNVPSYFQEVGPIDIAMPEISWSNDFEEPVEDYSYSGQGWQAIYDPWGFLYGNGS